MHVPFLDLQTQYTAIREEIHEAISDVLDTSNYILGPHVTSFENNFAQAHKCDLGLATNNGTSALHLALWALGIKRGDEVIVPVNTFIATAEAVLLCGGKPVFVDHDPYFNLDVERVEASITSRTKAVIAVHLYGQPAQMDALSDLCARRKILLIEDAAQAHLATFAGKPVGSWGAATAFSFYPGKNLGAYGEGGAVLTKDTKLHRAMKLLRDHGSEAKYTHVVAGHNYRMEALQGAILNVKLRYLPQWTEQRRHNAERYRSLLAGTPQVQLPLESPTAKSVYHLFVVQADRRDDLQAYLKSQDIDTGLHYPTPLHLQPCFAYLGYKGGAFPKAEASAKRILSLPMYPELSEEHIAYTCGKINEFYRQTS